MTSDIFAQQLENVVLSSKNAKKKTFLLYLIKSAKLINQKQL